MSFLNYLSIYLLFCCWVLCDKSAGMMCCYWLCACQINVSRSMQERILTARYNHLLAPSSFRYTDWVLHYIFVPIWHCLLSLFLFRSWGSVCFIVNIKVTTTLEHVFKENLLEIVVFFSLLPYHWILLLKFSWACEKENQSFC